MSKPNPEDRQYTKDHEWIKISGNNAVCGVTDHAQELLSDIVFVELPEPGKKVSAGESLAVLESVKSVSDVYAPLDGEVTEVNAELENAPELINKDAFGTGWIVKMTISNPSGVSGLLSAEDYEKYIQESDG